MLISKFNRIVIKIPVIFSEVLDKLIVKFIWKMRKTTILGRNKKGGMACLDIYIKHMMKIK